MKIRTALVTSAIVCYTVASQAMVIHNYCEKPEEGIKNESGIFNEDYLFLGKKLNFNGQAEDLVFLGKDLDFSGDAKLGVISFGERLSFSGSAGNGIIAGGKEVNITGKVTGNNYIGAKDITISNAADVNGNLFTGSEQLTISGPVTGNLYVAGKILTINSEINGNVKFYGKKITFGNNGKIKGNLFYATRHKLSGTECKRISGVVTYDERFSKSPGSWDGFRKKTTYAAILFGFGMFLSLLLVSSLIQLLPVFRRLDGVGNPDVFWKTFGWGVIPVLAYPALIVLSVAFIITIPLAALLVLAGLPLMFGAYIIGSVLIGRYLVRLFSWRVDKRYYHFLIGICALFIVSFIPVVNCLSVLLAVSLGWGIYLSFIFNKQIK